MTVATAGAERSSEVAAAFEELRRNEFGRLDAANHVFLDRVGGTLYPESLERPPVAGPLEAASGGGGSPAASVSGGTAAEMVRLRLRLLAFLEADPSDYEVVFTGDEAAALRMLLRHGPFGRGSTCRVTTDFPALSLAMTSAALRSGPRVEEIPVGPDLRVQDLGAALRSVDRGAANLLAFPARSPVTGVSHPLEWLERGRKHGFHVLLDASSHATTAALNLRRHRPDALIVSFRRLLGFPSSVTALLIRSSTIALRAAPAAPPRATATLPASPGGRETPAATLQPFCEATLSGIVAGLDLVESVRTIGLGSHLARLTRHFRSGLLSLKHPCGSPAAELLGCRLSQERSGVVIFSLLSASGAPLDAGAVRRAAARQGITVGTLCFRSCGTPGSPTRTGEVSVVDPLCSHSEGRTISVVGQMGRVPTPAALQVSFGMWSNRCDVDRFLAFLRRVL